MGHTEDPLGTGPILLATRSRGKLRELVPLFADFGLTVIDLDGAGLAETPAEDALEVFATFEENALAKGRYFFQLSGLPTVADDSGLEVRALGGRPGVRSKRWSGRPELTGQALDDANNGLLMSELAGLTDRRARYVCAATFVGAGLQIVERGQTGGRILDAAAGTGGFGYDPYFYSDELGAAFGELRTDEKAVVSHRARAFRALVSRLRSPRPDQRIDG